MDKLLTLPKILQLRIAMFVFLDPNFDQEKEIEYALAAYELYNNYADEDTLYAISHCNAGKPPVEGERFCFTENEWLYAAGIASEMIEDRLMSISIHNPTLRQFEISETAVLSSFNDTDPDPCKYIQALIMQRREEKGYIQAIHPKKDLCFVDCKMQDKIEELRLNLSDKKSALHIADEVILSYIDEFAVKAELVQDGKRIVLMNLEEDDYPQGLIDYMRD